MTKIYFVLLSSLLFSSCQVSFIASPNHLKKELIVFNHKCSQAFQREFVPPEEGYALKKEANSLSSKVHGPIGTLIGMDKYANDPVFVEFENNHKELESIWAQGLPVHNKEMKKEEGAPAPKQVRKDPPRISEKKKNNKKVRRRPAAQSKKAKNENNATTIEDYIRSRHERTIKSAH